MIDLDFTQYLTLPNLVIGGIAIIIIIRLFNNVRIFFGAKSYVKKASKLRRKKYNGLILVESTKKRRKKNSNSYQKLKHKPKSLVEKYFKYKEDELPGMRNYARGSAFRRNKEKLYIYVSNGKKQIMKFSMKKATKKFIDVTNKYNCLDEVVVYLHHLPEAILKHEEYEIFISDADVSIGYQIK